MYLPDYQMVINLCKRSFYALWKRLFPMWKQGYFFSELSFFLATGLLGQSLRAFS